MSDPLSNEQIDSLVSQLRSMNPEQLGTMDHTTLYRMRGRAPKDLQGKLAPYEHQAFAREATAENPLMALPIAAAIPLYQPYKAIQGQSRSPVSLDQVTQGYKGIGQGLWQAFQDGMRSIQGQLEGTGIGSSATGLLESLRSYPQSSNTSSRNHRLTTMQMGPTQ